MAQPARELGAGCYEDAGIDFADLALGIGGILLLHNALDSTIGPAHDAPVTGRVGEFSREQRHFVAARHIQQMRQRVMPRQRHIAI